VQRHSAGLYSKGASGQHRGFGCEAARAHPCPGLLAPPSPQEPSHPPGSSSWGRLSSISSPLSAVATSWVYPMTSGSACPCSSFLSSSHTCGASATRGCGEAGGHSGGAPAVRAEVRNQERAGGDGHSGWQAFGGGEGWGPGRRAAGRFGALAALRAHPPCMWHANQG
jgi:hypothetical protein